MGRQGRHGQRARGRQRQTLGDVAVSQGHLEPPEAGRDSEGSAPRTAGGNSALPKPCSPTSGLQTMREYISIVLSLPACDHVLPQTQETDTVTPPKRKKEHKKP